jgi:hypothetical protein
MLISRNVEIVTATAAVAYPVQRPRVSEVDDDLALRAAIPQVLDGLGGLAEWVGPVDDRSDLAGLDEFDECLQVLRVL